MHTLTHGAQTSAVCCRKAIHRQRSCGDAVAQHGSPSCGTSLCKSNYSHYSLAPVPLPLCMPPFDSSSRPAQFFFHVLSCHCQQAQSHRTYSQYNAKFEFSYTFEGQPCNFVMTSVLGHLFSTDFVERCATCLFPRTCLRANCFWPCTWPRSFPPVRSSFSNAPLAHGISFICFLLFPVAPPLPFNVTCNNITLLSVLSPHFPFFFAQQQQEVACNRTHRLAENGHSCDQVCT